MEEGSHFTEFQRRNRERLWEACFVYLSNSLCVCVCVIVKHESIIYYIYFPCDHSTTILDHLPSNSISLQVRILHFKSHRFLPFNLYRSTDVLSLKDSRMPHLKCFLGAEVIQLEVTTRLCNFFSFIYIGNKFLATLLCNIFHICTFFLFVTPQNQRQELHIYQTYIF